MVLSNPGRMLELEIHQIYKEALFFKETKKES